MGPGHVDYVLSIVNADRAMRVIEPPSEDLEGVTELPCPPESPPSTQVDPAPPSVPPADGWRVSSSYFIFGYVTPAPLADRGHISSSYSSSGVQTGDSIVADGCTAAALGGQNLAFRSAILWKQHVGTSSQPRLELCITEAGPTPPPHTKPNTTTLVHTLATCAET